VTPNTFPISASTCWASPIPAVATLEAMPSLQPGQILEVVSDCPQSINNIPLDARNHGYEVLEIQQDGPTIRYLIRK
jgi:TusA-related sulfurtransferase